MGYRLFRELKLAALDLTLAERLVAPLIGDDAGDDTRVSFLPVEELAGRPG
jgi:hypothetical protein